MLSSMMIFVLAQSHLIWLEHGPMEFFEASSSWGTKQITSAKLIVKESNKLGVNPYFMVAIATVESSLNPDAVNEKAKDVGLFQINYRWHREYFKITNFTDFKKRLLEPTLNIHYAHKVLTNMSRFRACKGKNLPACYHAGPGWKKSHRKQQISAYVNKVYKLERYYEKRYPEWKNK